MDVQDSLALTLSYEAEDPKGTIAKEDDGGLGSVPVLKYDEIAPVPRSQHAMYGTTMRQWGVMAGWGMMATSGTLSISYKNTIADGVVLRSGFLARVGELGLGAGGARAFDPKHIAAWSGTYTGGFLLMALLSWISSDYFGRKKTMLLALLLSTGAFLVQMLARHWSVWMAARLFTGMATGLNLCGVIAYLSEATPRRLRGSSLVTYQLAICAGQLFGSCAEQLLNLTSPSSYRRLLLSQLAFLGPAILAVTLLPESPRWCAATNQPDRAQQSLKNLRQGWEMVEVEAEYASLAAELDENQDHTFRSLFRGSSLRRLLISTFPLVWQCWLGVPAITRYFTYFFQLAGIIDPFSSRITLHIILFAGAIVAMTLVEKVGRRPLLLWLPPFMLVSLFAVGGLVRHAPKPWSGGVLTSLGCFWVACYGTSVGPLAFVYLGEVSNDRLKARTISIAATFAGLLNTIAIYCTPLMIANPTFRLFTAACLFGCVGLVGWVVCYFYIPETIGLSSLDFDDLFRKQVPGRTNEQFDDTLANNSTT